MPLGVEARPLIWEERGEQYLEASRPFPQSTGTLWEAGPTFYLPKLIFLFSGTHFYLPPYSSNPPFQREELSFRF